MNKIIWVAVAILVVASGWYYASRKSVVVAPTTEQEGMMEDIVSSGSLMVSENAVMVNNQNPGVSVKISFASFAEGGYVVIHEGKDDGMPGAILGNVGHLLPGESRDVEVMLSRPSVDKENLFAMLHQDNGDGVFNLNDDAPIKDDEGNIVMVKFMIDKAVGQGSEAMPY